MAAQEQTEKLADCLKVESALDWEQEERKLTVASPNLEGLALDGAGARPSTLDLPTVPLVENAVFVALPSWLGLVPFV